MIYADAMMSLIQLAQTASETTGSKLVLRSLSDMNIEYYFYIPLAVLIVAYFIWSGRLGKKAFKNSPPHLDGFGAFDLLIVIGLYISGIALYSLLVVQIAKQGWMAGVKITENGGLEYGGEMQQATLSMLGQFCQYIGPIAFIAYKCLQVKKGLTAFGLATPHFFKDLWAGFIGFLASIITINGAIAVVLILSLLAGQHVPIVGHEVLNAIMQSKSLTTVVLFSISAVIIAPFAEELFYRGVLQTALGESFKHFQRENALADNEAPLPDVPLKGYFRWITILFASAIFMMVHIGSVPTWHPLVGHFILGLFLGWLYERRGSLWPCITLHMLFNGFNIAVVLLAPK